MKQEDVFGMGERIISSYLNDNWIERNPSIFRFTSPTVLMVGGNDTNEPRKANGYCKFFEEICSHLNHDQLKKYGIYYKSGEYSDAVIGQVMCDSLLKPLYLTASGTLRPLEEIKQRFANINIFTHCKGSSVVTHMGRAVKESLLSYGLSEEEVLSATQQIFVAHYAPFLDTMKDNVFNNAFFFSGSDQLVFSDTFFKRYLVSPQDFINYAGCGRIYENHGNVYFYTDCLGDDDTQNDHHIPVIRNNYGHYRCEAMLGCIEKMFSVYTNRSIVSNKLGRAVEIDRSKVCDEMRENITRLEETHIEQEEKFKSETYHPEYLVKCYAAIANYFEYKQTHDKTYEVADSSKPSEEETIRGEIISSLPKDDSTQDDDPAQ